jgi:hypothetical protein
LTSTGKIGYPFTKLSLSLMKAMKIEALLALLLLSATISYGQSLSGTVVDTKGETLIGVTVRLASLPDSSSQRGVVTDVDGQFMFDNLAVGVYRLQVSYVGFATKLQTVRVDTGAVKPLRIVLGESARQLREVVVKGKIVSAEQEGDTLQLNADAYKVNRDAQAEDLLKKMPGVDMSGGDVKVQGETVREVLVDGKPFFGDDPTIALKNLPAEVIAKIEIFDRQSDQSQFTGVNDGNTTKTINIVTRPDKRNGQFGRVYGGVGTNGTYSAGASVNIFNGDQRISIIGQSNDINQQNFSSQDLLGVQSSGGGGGRGGGGRRGGGGGGGGVGGPPGGGGAGVTPVAVAVLPIIFWWASKTVSTRPMRWVSTTPTSGAKSSPCAVHTL